MLVMSIWCNSKRIACSEILLYTYCIVRHGYTPGKMTSTLCFHTRIFWFHKINKITESFPSKQVASPKRVYLRKMIYMILVHRVSQTKKWSSNDGELSYHHHHRSIEHRRSERSTSSSGGWYAGGWSCLCRWWLGGLGVKRGFFGGLLGRLAEVGIRSFSMLSEMVRFLNI